LEYDAFSFYVEKLLLGLATNDHLKLVVNCVHSLNTSHTKALRRNAIMANQIVVRFDPRTLTVLRKVVEARGEDVSDLVRRAVKIELAKLSYLSPEEKKALGIYAPTIPSITKSEGGQKQGETEVV